MPPVTPPPAPASDLSCQTALRAWLVDGALPDRVDGLAACRRADLAAVLGPGVDGQGRYGGIPRAFTTFEREPSSIRAVWDGEGILMIVAEDLPIKAPDALLARLGAPEAEWPSRTNRFDQTIADQVFASRGMTLSVATSLLEPPGPTQIVVAYLYAPTTVEDYRGRLGGKDEWVRRFPRR